MILAPPVRKAVLDAWNTLDVDAVERVAGQKLKNRAAEAKKLLAAKAENPTFEQIEFWWLDEYMEDISFGQHSHTASELKAMEPDAAKELDDRTISIKWKCGLHDNPSEIKKGARHPGTVPGSGTDYAPLPDPYPMTDGGGRKKRGFRLTSLFSA